MGKVEQIAVECDVCDKPSHTFKDDDAAKKAGWVMFGWEGYYVDRDFHTAWVCPSCANSIVANRAKSR